MNRRSFLATILILATPPAIVRASSLMPIREVEVFRDVPFAELLPIAQWLLLPVARNMKAYWVGEGLAPVHPAFDIVKVEILPGESVAECAARFRKTWRNKDDYIADGVALPEKINEIV